MITTVLFYSFSLAGSIACAFGAFATYRQTFK